MHRRFFEQQKTAGFQGVETLRLFFVFYAFNFTLFGGRVKPAGLIFCSIKLLA